MSKFKLSELLEATKPFATGNGSQASLEASLREIEARENNITSEEVTEVSYETLCEAISQLTMCVQQVIVAIIGTFNGLGYKAIENFCSHFAFGEHWNELSEYVGYVPAEYESWQALKDQFAASGQYDDERPLPVNIRKDDTIIVVNLYGFKVLESPTDSSLETTAAITGRVALCKTLTTNEYVAIAW